MKQRFVEIGHKTVCKWGNRRGETYNYFNLLIERTTAQMRGPQSESRSLPQVTRQS